jgi:membrane protease YdiL (CAAX protease family)
MAGTLVALVVSAAIFGLLHAANPGASLVSSASIALEAGVLLGLAYALTRSLWLPIGLHFGWNFTEGGIFGAAVSGGQSHGLVKAAVVGPDLLTGGAFGPEASVVAVVLSLVVSAAMGWLVVRRGHWKPLTFRLRLD